MLQYSPVITKNTTNLSEINVLLTRGFRSAMKPIFSISVTTNYLYKISVIKPPFGDFVLPRRFSLSFVGTQLLMLDSMGSEKKIEKRNQVTFTETRREDNKIYKDIEMLEPPKPQKSHTRTNRCVNNTNCNHIKNKISEAGKLLMHPVEYNT